MSQVNREGSGPWTEGSFSPQIRVAQLSKGQEPTVVGGKHRTEATVEWPKCADDGGAAVAGYVLKVVADGGPGHSGWAAISVETSPSTTVATVQGLRPGRKYAATFAIKNAAGLGKFSPPARFRCVTSDSVGPK